MASGRVGAEHAACSETPTIGYVIKGYPRLSELFIASEIHRLERIGFRLRLFAIKAADEAFRHPILDRIEAPIDYLPATESVSGTPLWRWLPRHARRFAGPLIRTLARWPVGVGRGALAALAQAVRARERFWSPPRKVYVKEFLQAIAIADRLRGAPDIRHLHAHFCHGATTVTWLAALIAGRTFSFTAHAKDIYMRSLNPAGLLARKLAAARFAVTCTDANRAYLEQYAGSTPVHRVYHGLNAEFAEIVAGERADPERAARAAILRIVAVGRHVDKKGFDVLIDACADLAGRGVPLEAAIIGESGDQTRALADRIERCGLADRITLSGPMPQRVLLQAYRRATVFCLPCRVSGDGDRDGIPNVLLEAMASGLPVVTTNVSGIPELVENEGTGLLVAADDAHATSAALLRIFRDPALAARLAASGRAVVAERFDGDRLIGELATLFRRVA